MVKNIYSLKEIDLSHITEEPVKKLIAEHIRAGMVDFDNVVSTYTKGEDLSDFSLHERIYHLPAPVPAVWEHYTQSNPSEAWNGKSLKFGMLISKKTHSVLYPGDDYEGGMAGQVLYISLKFLGGLIKLGVAHEIIEVNHNEKFMELSYVKGGASWGMQHIAFTDGGNGSTRIVHTTRYKSHSPFRDKIIYPGFHTKVVNEYHANMLRTLNEKLKKDGAS